MNPVFREKHDTEIPQQLLLRGYVIGGLFSENSENEVKDATAIRSSHLWRLRI